MSELGRRHCRYITEASSDRQAKWIYSQAMRRIAILDSVAEDREALSLALANRIGENAYHVFERRRKK